MEHIRKIILGINMTVATVARVILSLDDPPSNPQSREHLQRILQHAFHRRPMWLATFDFDFPTGMHELDSAPLQRLGFWRKVKIVRIREHTETFYMRLVEESSFIDGGFLILGGDSWSNDDLRKLDRWLRNMFPTVTDIKEVLFMMYDGCYLDWTCPPENIVSTVPAGLVPPSTSPLGGV